MAADATMSRPPAPEQLAPHADAHDDQAVTVASLRARDPSLTPQLSYHPDGLHSVSSPEYTHSPLRFTPSSSSATLRTPTRPALRSVSSPLHTTSSTAPASRAPTQRSFKELVNRFNINANAAEKPPLPPSSSTKDRPHEQSSAQRRLTRLPRPQSPGRSSPFPGRSSPLSTPTGRRIRNKAVQSPFASSPSSHRPTNSRPASVSRRGSEGNAQRDTSRPFHRRSLSDASANRHAQAPGSHATSDPLQHSAIRSINARPSTNQQAQGLKATRLRPAGKENFPSRIPVSPPTRHSKASDSVLMPSDPASQTLRAYINVPVPTRASPPLRSSRPRQPVSAVSTAPTPVRISENRAASPETAANGSRRRSPYLNRSDFAERRARIERAISQTIDERSEQLARRTRDSHRSSGSRLSSLSIDQNSGDSTASSQLMPGAFPLSDVQGGSIDVDSDLLKPMKLASSHDGLTDEGSSYNSADSSAEQTSQPLSSEVDKSTDYDLTAGDQISDEHNALPARTLLTDMLQKRDRSESSNTDSTRDSIAGFLESSAGDIDHDSHEQESASKLADNFRGLSVSHNPPKGYTFDSAIEKRARSSESDRISTTYSAPNSDNTDNDVLTPRSKQWSHNILAADMDRTPRPVAKNSPRTLSNSSLPLKESSPFMVDFRDSAAVSTDDSQDESDIEPETGLSGAVMQVEGMLSERSRLKQLDAMPDTSALHSIATRSDRVSSSTSPIPARVSSRRVVGEAVTVVQQDVTMPEGEGFAATSPQPSRPLVTKLSSRETIDEPRHSSLDTASRVESILPLTRAISSQSISSPVRRRPLHSERSRTASAAAIVRSTEVDLRSAKVASSSPHGQGLGLIIDTGIAGQYSPLPSLPFPSHTQATSDSSPDHQRARTANEQIKALHRNSYPSPKTAGYLPGFQRKSVTRARSSVETQLGKTAVAPEGRYIPVTTKSSARSSIVDSAGTPPAASELDSEQRRLLKRRNTMKELLDTEYSHHQDMKIILDIYKATVGDLITAEDRQALFGNINKVESLSLEVYDALKPAVAPFYVPQRSSRWHAKRASYATSATGTQSRSDSDTIDEDKDRKTTVGHVFKTLLPKMEEVYGTYLRNHDLANQRLAKLQGDPSVQCWLTECHKNASDITTAWDLDSLLVKPVQRILKYPLLLQQLLEATTVDHPDRPELVESVQESMNMSQRINEAKKRADLVEQIVTRRKRRDNDVKSGLAKAFGRRGDRAKERLGIAEAFQDPIFDELAHRFGGHFIRLQVCMRDVQDSLTETDKAVGCFNAFAASLEAYVDISTTAHTMTSNKWRKYALAVRELAAVALPDHRAQIQKRVIGPMMTAVKLHQGPQSAIAQRKQTMVDYAKRKWMESKGEKVDKRTIEASQLYEALNEQLKIDLPRLYTLTSRLIQSCLACHLDIQKEWMWTWENKLRPVLDKFPAKIATIEPTFVQQFELSLASLANLGICNGSLLADIAELSSPPASLMNDSIYSRVPSLGARTTSIGSEASHAGLTPDKVRSARGSMSLSPMLPPDSGSATSLGQSFGRSTSSISNRGRAVSAQTVPTRMSSNPSRPSYSSSRAATLGRMTDATASAGYKRYSTETFNHASPRPGSDASEFGGGATDQHSTRYSDTYASGTNSLFSDNVDGNSGTSTPRTGPEGAPVRFVAASLFEFNIDRARKESGYPYLTYVQGEVFDVIGQKGELWLARNQDDATWTLGWIWEQHFVILSQEV